MKRYKTAQKLKDRKDERTENSFPDMTMVKWTDMFGG